MNDATAPASDLLGVLNTANTVHSKQSTLRQIAMHGAWRHAEIENAVATKAEADERRKGEVEANIARRMLSENTLVPEVAAARAFLRNIFGAAKVEVSFENDRYSAAQESYKAPLLRLRVHHWTNWAPRSHKDDTNIPFLFTEGDTYHHIIFATVKATITKDTISFDLVDTNIPVEGKEFQSASSTSLLNRPPAELEQSLVQSIREMVGATPVLGPSPVHWTGNDRLFEHTRNRALTMT